MKELEDTPDAKLNVACSGEALRIARDFSAAFPGIFNSHPQSYPDTATHLANLGVFPSGLASQ